MIYNNVVSGRFVSRPNRFIAIVDVDGAEQMCHVKNTGRCREYQKHISETEVVNKTAYEVSISKLEIVE